MAKQKQNNQITFKQNKMENGSNKNGVNGGYNHRYFLYFLLYLCPWIFILQFNQMWTQFDKKLLNSLVHFFYECGSQSNRNTEQLLIYSQWVLKAVKVKVFQGHYIWRHVPFFGRPHSFYSEISFALTGRQRGILLYSN